MFSVLSDYVFISLLLSQEKNALKAIPDTLLAAPDTLKTVLSQIRRASYQPLIN